MRRCAWTVIAFLVMAVGLTVPAATANALQAVAQDRVVSDDPAGFTPNVLDGRVYAVVQAGNRIILGGSFTQAQNAGSTTTLTRNRVLAFNATTGVIDTSFAPNVDGDVNALAVSADGQSVYLGGAFNTVNGVASKSLARLSISTGLAVSGFKVPAFDAVIQDLKLSGGTLYVAGYFSKAGTQARSCLAALNAATGAVLPSVSFAFGGTSNGGVTQAYKIDITPDGSRMVVIGNFATIDGADRNQIAMIDLTTSPASLANWQTGAYKPLCYAVFEFYVRDVEFSPDGSYFVVGVTGGYGSGPPSLCDTASRWETAAAGSALQPTWVDYTGGDTTYAVGVTATAVYVGGHQRWWNNPSAADSPGPGAVARTGIGALDPVNGLPLAWNPTRTRGSGVFDFLATSTGLWVGSDTDRIGQNYEYHARIAYFPLAGGKLVPRPNPGTLPGEVYQMGRLAPPGQSNVLYRVNAGGPTIPTLDDGPDWQGDQTSTSPYRNTGSNAASYNSGATLDSSVPAGTPIGVFSTERWDPSGGNDLQWHFPVTTGQSIEVRLFLANQCSCTSQAGQRVFNVSLDGQPALTNYDIVADVGNQVGTMKKWDITSDGSVDINFSHVTENPLVDAIEIVRLGPPPPPSDVLYRVNAGGPSLAALDNGPAWAADSSDPNPYRNSGSSASTWGGIANVAATVPASTPSAVFGTERWDPATAPELQWAFPVSSGTHLRVRLYFAAQCSCTSTVGSRVFDVSIDGTKVLDHYDIVADAGYQTGTMKSFDVTSDGTVNIDFAHETENPLVNAIEIIDLDGAPPPPPPVDTDLATHRSFDGTTAGPSTTMSSTGISWSVVRGAFMLDGTLYYGDINGNLHSRTFNGSTFGAETLVNGSDQVTPLAAWHADVQQATSMWYWQGRIYYTLKSDAHLYYRYFTRDSGTVGATRFTASGNVTGIDLGKVQGALLSGNQLYWVNRDDGALHRIGWQSGTLVAGTDTVIDSSSDWRSRALFLYVPSGGTAPNQAPVAKANVACTGAACTAYELGSADRDPDGWLTNWSWNWGDGTTATGPRSTHAYAAGGTYNVTLTVTDNSGATATDTTQVTVTGGNQAPVASFTSTCTGLSCSFDASASVDNDGSIASYAWTFGDGGTATGKTPTHPYAGGGTFTVTLTVTDNQGAPGATSQQVTVTAPNQAPTASFTASCGGTLTCSFDAGGSFDSDGTIVSYAWDFGDGATGTGKTTTHPYGSAGSRTVTLTVTDNQGATGTATKVVTPGAAAISFLGKSETNANATSHQVTVPAGTQAGDGLILAYTVNTSTVTIGDPTGVTGWSLVGTATSGTVVTKVWQKAAAGTDAGKTVAISLGTTFAKADMLLLAYHGTAATPVTAFDSRSESAAVTNHVTPTVTAPDGALLLSYWADKGTTTTWAPPAGQTVRTSSIGAGTAHIDALATDAVVGAGSAGGLTATADVAGRATMWSLVLAP
ncbi:MAG: PKD domain-containing protein [Frankiaceae bacterium]